MSRYRLKSYPDTFLGNEAVAWLAHPRGGGLSSVAEALEVGNTLLEMRCVRILSACVHVCACVCVCVCVCLILHYEARFLTDESQPMLTIALADISLTCVRTMDLKTSKALHACLVISPA